jgi:hypothetical protein
MRFLCSDSNALVLSWRTLKKLKRYSVMISNLVADCGPDGDIFVPFPAKIVSHAVDWNILYAPSVELGDFEDWDSLECWEARFVPIEQERQDIRDYAAGMSDKDVRGLILVADFLGMALLWDFASRVLCGRLDVAKGAIERHGILGWGTTGDSRELPIFCTHHLVHIAKFQRISTWDSDGTIPQLKQILFDDMLNRIDIFLAQHNVCIRDLLDIDPFRPVSWSEDMSFIHALYCDARVRMGLGKKGLQEMALAVVELSVRWPQYRKGIEAFLYAGPAQ